MVHKPGALSDCICIRMDLLRGKNHVTGIGLGLPR